MIYVLISTLLVFIIAGGEYVEKFPHIFAFFAFFIAGVIEMIFKKIKGIR